jgi:hypothetical protein
MKVQEHVTACQEHISFLEMLFLMLVINLDSLKRSVSVENWFETHKVQTNDFTRLIWTKRWHKQVEVSVSYVCKALYLLLHVSAL